MTLGRRERPRPSIKTPDEIEAMRRSSRLTRQIVATLGERVAPGVTTRELELLARTLTDEAGAKAAFYQYRVGAKVYPDYLCASVNEAVVHGIPNDRPLEPGDVVSLDFGLVVDGWYGDTAYTWCVGEAPPATAHLLQTTREALAIGIAAAHPGRRIFDVARAIQKYVEGQGCGVVRELVGHGIGQQLHEPPQVPNYAAMESRRDLLRPGMTLCIEPMVTAGSYQVKELPDQWTVVTLDGSLAAHYEHTVVILSDGAEVLSLPNEL